MKEEGRSRRIGGISLFFLCFPSRSDFLLLVMGWGKCVREEEIALSLCHPLQLCHVGLFFSQ